MRPLGRRTLKQLGQPSVVNLLHIWRNIDSSAATVDVRELHQNAVKRED